MICFTNGVQMPKNKKIFEFLDYRAYLQYWFEKKKKERSTFSYRVFSRQIGQKSPSYLKDVIEKRRNINFAHFEILTKALQLKHRERIYFRNLIVLDQSKDREEKKKAFELISAMRSVDGSRLIEGESYRYVSNWYFPAIREMANLPEFQPHAEWIVEHIYPKITKKQAKDALETLQDLEMLVIHEDGRFECQDGLITTPDEVFGLAVHSYHKQMLDLASGSIDGIDPKDRHFLGVTVSANENLLPIIKEELNLFAAKICQLCDANEEKKDRALQLNVHFFPLSKSTK